MHLQKVYAKKNGKNAWGYVRLGISAGNVGGKGAHMFTFSYENGIIYRMENYCAYVDVFFGCDNVDLPKRKGMAKGWRPIKGLAGNTSPAACLPFGKMSCVAYSGAYPTGYGNCSVNSCRKIPPMFKYHRFCGLSHVHQSGTGFIDFFYNFALTAPSEEGLADAFNPRKILAEEAYPGFYFCKTERENAACTVTGDSAFQVFETKKAHDVFVDFSQNGLSKTQKNKNIFSLYERATCHVEGDTAFCTVSFFGVPVYFAMRSKCRTLPKIWHGAAVVSENAWSAEKFDGAFGVVFKCDKEKTETVLSISYLSEEHALSRLERDFVLSFDEVKKRGCERWNETLSRIEVEGDETDKKIFYSNLYHTLIKPTDVSGERLYGFDGECVTDIATIWDMYKTQFPLLFSVYPEIGKKVIQTMISYREKNKQLPNAYLISSDCTRCDGQARFLTANVFADAFLRGVGDKEEMYRTLKEEYLSDKYRPFREGFGAERTTYAMDLFEGEICLALLAEANGDTAFAEALRHRYEHIDGVFSKKTGLALLGSPYYEGNHVNYSFRLFSDGARRVKNGGGEKKFNRLLDYFFGYRLPFVKYGKFEGFNNESDMEAVFSYQFINRHDRICEIIDASRKYMWALGRGGMPGNNDSGGLSSLYVWNAIGLFPATGQDKYFISLPLFDKVVVHLPQGDLTVTKEGKGIYVREAVLNGKKLTDFTCSVRDVQQGGSLHFVCQEQK